MGLSLPQVAEKTLKRAKNLLLKIQSDEDDQLTKDRDHEELAAIHAQLYLCYLITKKLPEAAESVEESIKYMSLKNGERSNRLCSKYY